MGVYIKGMEMPKNCSACPFCFGANNICPWVMEYATCKGRHKDCPLVPVPPHGRLGDLDKLADNMCSATAGMEHRAIIMHEIRRAPTVIEA